MDSKSITIGMMNEESQSSFEVGVNGVSIQPTHDAVPTEHTIGIISNSLKNISTNITIGISNSLKNISLNNTKKRVSIKNNLYCYCMILKMLEEGLYYK